MNRKIKVAWICHLSNSQIRDSLKFDKWSPMVILRRLTKKIHMSDYASWNIKAIREFEKFDDIELHIIAPHPYISDEQSFMINNISYHFFENEDESLCKVLRYKITKKNKSAYHKNSHTICKIIQQIQPDLIHLIGAENPHYSESVLHLPTNIPLIVSLQTLMNDPDFLKNYPISNDSYRYRSAIEKEILLRADYIGTELEHFIKLIKSNIYEGAKFLDMSLAVGEDIIIRNYQKSYDFVYFAADISKAIDYAIEAFAIAKQRYPNITLHVVGGFSDGLMSSLRQRMYELNLGDEVDFTGRLKTFDDVLNEVRKARFALLPLKIDQISGTIRESMANGLPVVTTITPATPKLNEKRESVLLSKKGDFQSMADNMCRLLSDEKFAQVIQQNAVVTLNEKYSNVTAMQKWRENYYKILNIKMY